MVDPGRLAHLRLWKLPEPKELLFLPSLSLPRPPSQYNGAGSSLTRVPTLGTLFGIPVFGTYLE